MSLPAIDNPFALFTDLKGALLNGGRIYIGNPGQDPQTSPKAVYWDEDGSIPASQPLDVVGGYIIRLGTPAQVFTSGAYSIRVLTRLGVQVFYSPEFSSAAVEVGELRDEVNSLNGRVALAESDIDALQGQVQNLTPRVAANEAAIAALNVQIGSIGPRLSAAEADIDALQGDVTALQAGQSTGTVIFPTKAAMDAAAASYPANTKAEVWNDPTPANNGVYQKNGALGGGSWTYIGALGVAALGVRVDQVEDDIEAIEEKVYDGEATSTGDLVGSLIDGAGKAYAGWRKQDGRLIGASPRGLRPYPSPDVLDPLNDARWQTYRSLPTPWPGQLPGTTGDPIYDAQDVSDVVYLLVIMGQSLAEGFNDSPSGTDLSISTTSLYPGYVLMPETGLSVSGAPKFDGFVNLIEDSSPSGVRETMASSMGNHLHASVLFRTGIAPTIAVINAAKGGRSFRQLKRGSQWWQAMLQGVRQSVVAARALKRRVIAVPIWAQGQAEYNAGTSRVEYARFMRQLVRWFREDVGAITLQKEGLPLFLDVMSNSDSGKNPYTGEQRLETPWSNPATLAMGDLAEDADFCVVGTDYAFSRSGTAGSTGLIHLTSRGYYYQGQMFARAILTHMFGPGWHPVRITGAEWHSNTELDVWYSRTIQLRTSGEVTPPTINELGFTFWDDSGSPPAIDSVELISDPARTDAAWIAANSGDTEDADALTAMAVTGVRITLSGVSTGRRKKLYYATYKDAWTSGDGPSTGARGCVASAEGDVSLNAGILQYDWAIPQVVELPEFSTPDAAGSAAAAQEAAAQAAESAAEAAASLAGKADIDLGNASVPAISGKTGSVSAPAVLKFGERASLVNFGLPGNESTAIDSVLAAAMNASAFDNIAIDIPARENPYLVGNIKVPYNSAWDTNPQPVDTMQVRLFGQTGATFKKVSSDDNDYLMAPILWANDAGYLGGPVVFENIVFDGAGIARDTAVVGFWGSRFENCVFRDAVRHGAYSPSVGRTGGALGATTVGSRFRGCTFYRNGRDGFVLEDVDVSQPFYITDGWLENCRSNDNGGYQVNLGQCAGWVVSGNHTWTDLLTTPVGVQALVRIKDALAATFTGNVWEGYYLGSPELYSVHFAGGYGAVTLSNESFLRGLGVYADFGGSAEILDISSCRFVGPNSHIMHARNELGYYIQSSGNSFDCPTPYRFSGGPTHAEAIVANRDRISTKRPLFDGEQREGLYSIWQPDRVQYPTSDANGSLFYRSAKNQRYTVPLTADRDLVLPDAPFNGMEYKITRAGTSTGAYSIVLKTFSGTPVINIPTSFYVYVKYDGLTWCVIEQSTVP